MWLTLFVIAVVTSFFWLYYRKAFRLIASAVILIFMFVEELILKPLRNLHVLILERTIKRMNGYATIISLVTIKSVEGLCKVALWFSPNAYWVMFIVFMDGLLGFVSMNIIIHGHDNLKDFTIFGVTD